MRRRSVPPVVKTDFSNRATGTIYCRSVYNSRDPWAQQAKFARIVESLPQIARHQTHTGGAIAWRNHGGSIGRVLGTVPLASDGSFYVELPAGRTFHIQALDADRQVVVNELIWQYVRPGERKGCVGCHEAPDKTPFVSPGFGQAFQEKPILMLPNADKMRYRAKVCRKADLSDEREERVRMVGAVNLMGRE